MKQRLPLLIALGDTCVFLLFGLVGLRSHERGIGASELLRAMLPFSVSWLAIAWGLGWLREDSALDSLSRRLFRAWLPAWACGLILRGLLFGRGFAPTFAVIAFVFQGGLLLLWRIGANAFLSRRRQEGL